MEYFDNLLGEQLTEGGGGGSSDFSIANVTIQGGDQNEIAGISNLIIVNDEYGIYREDITGENPGSYVAVLYHGLQSIEMDVDTYNSSTGACTYNPDAELLTITGDCTIVMNYAGAA